MTKRNSTFAKLLSVPVILYGRLLIQEPARLSSWRKMSNFCILGGTTFLFLSLALDPFITATDLWMHLIRIVCEPPQNVKLDKNGVRMLEYILRSSRIVGYDEFQN